MYPVVKWLLASRVACQEQPLAGLIPNREREHPIQMLQTVEVELAIGGKNDFRVGARLESVPARLELGPEFLEIINFTVERDPDQTVRSRHGLPARWAQVDNREPPVTETRHAVNNRISSIRAAMYQEVAHFLYEFNRRRSAR
jgi:hypothetical protein